MPSSARTALSAVRRVRGHRRWRRRPEAAVPGLHAGRRVSHIAANAGRVHPSRSRHSGRGSAYSSIWRGGTTMRCVIAWRFHHARVTTLSLRAPIRPNRTGYRALVEPDGALEGGWCPAERWSPRRLRPLPAGGAQVRAGRSRPRAAPGAGGGGSTTRSPLRCPFHHVRCANRRECALSARGPRGAQRAAGRAGDPLRRCRRHRARPPRTRPAPDAAARTSDLRRRRPQALRRPTARPGRVSAAPAAAGLTAPGSRRRGRR